MGAKQSKRSVDISGKEAESAGEVAAGAGGEGRVEQLADVDALKPQLNGDAHIHETSDKDKELDSGTPENEKDATTEKESKEQEDDKDKESSVITNGDSEQKGENGEPIPSPEDAKKPKKEKVKKKWSLRSISFSRKDKPKQEKKQKEEEPKTNGEPEKVPEEISETIPENETNGLIQEVKSETENKDEKTPETPVTEPITNGSSTPVTPKEETPTTDEPTNITKENDRTESAKDEVDPEQLPINGLALEEAENKTAEPVEIAASKVEETNVEKPEPVPATEIPEKNEVCVEKSPLIESSPPPLPANPPPSSVASFAATTMAPELTDASLANTEITSNAARIDTPDTNSESNAELASDIQSTIETEVVTIVDTIEVKPIEIGKPDGDLMNKDSHISIISEVLTLPEVPETISVDIPQKNINPESSVSNDVVDDDLVIKNVIEISSDPAEQFEKIVDVLLEQTAVSVKNVDIANINSVELAPVEIVTTVKTINIDSATHLPESNKASGERIQNDDVEEEIENQTNISTQIVEVIESNRQFEDEKIMTNGEATPVIDEATDSVPIITPEDSMPPSLSEPSELPQAGDAEDGSESLPPPPSELGVTPAPQELISASDKIAELIPEIPSVPELKAELETTTDVAVTN